MSFSEAVKTSHVFLNFILSFFTDATFLEQRRQLGGKEVEFNHHVIPFIPQILVFFIHLPLNWALSKAELSCWNQAEKMGQTEAEPLDTLQTSKNRELKEWRKGAEERHESRKWWNCKIKTKTLQTAAKG